MSDSSLSDSDLKGSKERVYQCANCGDRHKPPTGKKCTRSNGKNGMIMPKPTMDTAILVDSTLTGGGAHFGANWYFAEFTPKITADRSISDLEMLNAVVAIAQWADKLEGHYVHLRCDNAAAVSVLQTGRGRSPFLLACARVAWRLTARFKFHLVVSHIAGRDNDLADRLSRCHVNNPARLAMIEEAASHGATLVQLCESDFDILQDSEM